MTRQQSTPRKKAQNYSSLKEIAPRTETQEDYLNTIENNIVTFGLGPAGTGKTYLAMYQALCHLWNKKDTGINKIVLTRPVVEAGEKLGFLPGVIEEKLDPYMRPLYDSMNGIVGIEAARDKIAKGVIEIVPVAYMRGRTFHNCFIILDEAQNCSYTQIKMVLTRLGENTKLAISGDSSQSDLNGKSGLAKIVSRLSETKDIGVCKFTTIDVVRSEIVKNVLLDLEKYEERED